MLSQAPVRDDRLRTDASSGVLDLELFGAGGSVEVVVRPAPHQIVTVPRAT